MYIKCRCKNTSLQPDAPATGVKKGKMPKGKKKMSHTETIEMANSREENMVVAEVAANAERGVCQTANSEPGCEQPNLSLTPERQEEFDWCCDTLDRHKRSVPETARAIAIIDREGYYVFHDGGNFDNMNDFVHEIYGLERTYIHRMKKYGYWLLENDIPEGREPAETCVREMLQNGFSDEDRREIYRNAQENCFRRRKNDAKKSSSRSEEKSESDSESSGNNSGDGVESCVAIDPEEVVQTVPEAKDIRKALKEFKEASGKIYFPLLDNKSYGKDTTFQQILEENADKIKSIRTVLDCFQHYKAVTNMTLVPTETAQAVRDCIATLISEAKDEMEELLRDSSITSDHDTI